MHANIFLFFPDSFISSKSAPLHRRVDRVRVDTERSVLKGDGGVGWGIQIERKRGSGEEYAERGRDGIKK